MTNSLLGPLRIFILFDFVQKKVLDLLMFSAFNGRNDIKSRIIRIIFICFMSGTILYDTKELDKRINLSIENYKKNLFTIKTRISADILDSIRVEVYGDQKPINTIANVSVRGQELLVSPWDKALASPISKAIQTSDLNLSPIVDSKDVRVPIPTLSQDRRKELVKAVEHKAEESKVAIRNIRRDEIDKIKKMEKDGHMSEDDLKRCTKDIEKIIENSIKEIEKLLKEKSKDLLSN